MSGWSVFLIVLAVLLLLGGLGWLGYSHYRARRLGLPAPSLNPFARRQNDPTAYRTPAPAPGGLQGWVREKWTSLKNTRTAGGAYESTNVSGGRAARGGRGFGPLDPDEAWDTRVGNEADYAGGYYEETELGLREPGQGPYGGGGYGEGDVGVGGLGGGRGRQRELDDRYEEEVHGGGQNPFGDDHAVGLRGVSPRPVQGGGGKDAGAGQKKGHQSLGQRSSLDDSPTERRSMFREDV